MEEQLKIRLNVSCGWRSIPFSIIGHCRSDEVQFLLPVSYIVLLITVFHNIMSYISTVSIKSLLTDHRIPTSILCYGPFVSASAMSSAHSSILCQSKSASEVYCVSSSRYWQVTFLKNTRSRTWEHAGQLSRIGARNHCKWIDQSLPKYTPPWMRPSSDSEGPNAAKITTNLLFLNIFFRRNLACSLTHIFDSNNIQTALWGDLLHEVRGGLVSLPHVSINSIRFTDDHRRSFF